MRHPIVRTGATAPHSSNPPVRRMRVELIAALRAIVVVRHGPGLTLAIRVLGSPEERRWTNDANLRAAPPPSLPLRLLFPARENMRDAAGELEIGHRFGLASASSLLLLLAALVQIRHRRFRHAGAQRIGLRLVAHDAQREVERVLRAAAVEWCRPPAPASPPLLAADSLACSASSLHPFCPPGMRPSILAGGFPPRALS